MNRGFSLVELSLVLVIVGLLAGGILGGQSLIRAAELRSIGTDFTRFKASVNAFRDQYNALPGDMVNATSYWGDRTTGANPCPDAGVTDGSPGTCNGDGDGLISIGPEGHQAWQQLTLAGLLEGTYTGYNGGGSGCAGTCDDVAGVNVPRSRISNGGFSFVRSGQDPVGDAASTFATILSVTSNYNAFIFGAKQANFYYDQPILRPADAWNIDVKLDDGRPQYGKVYPFRHINCTTTNDPATAEYAVNSSAQNCNLLHQF